MRFCFVKAPRTVHMARVWGIRSRLAAVGAKTHGDRKETLPLLGVLVLFFRSFLWGSSLPVSVLQPLRRDSFKPPWRQNSNRRNAATARFDSQYVSATMSFLHLSASWDFYRFWCYMARIYHQRRWRRILEASFCNFSSLSQFTIHKFFIISTYGAY